MKHRKERDSDDEDVLLQLREAPPPVMDPFTERRLRERVLRGELPTPAGASVKHGRRLAAALLFAAAAALFLFWRRSEPVVTTSSQWVTITASDGAAYRRIDEEDGNVRVTIDAGSVDFQVGEHAERRLVVVVPDGEIEDLGTVFSVRVEHRRTTGISVQQGSIVFRREGLDALILEAGQSYDGVLHVAVEVKTNGAAQGSAAAPSPTPSEPSVPTARAIGPTRAKASAAQAASADAVGDAEDDAFLRVIALRREGRHEEARLAARDYLRRFPSGFRRVEMAKMAE
jgi:hypothetical protein